MGRPGGRDGLPTVRISNLSKDAMDSDVRELIAKAYLPRPARVHIVSDHITKMSKGFAFVSFEERATAEQCIVKLNGKGYDNLILNVSWTGNVLSLFRNLLWLTPFKNLESHERIACNTFPKRVSIVLTSDDFLLY